jgi:hypothetical protein
MIYLLSENEKSKLCRAVQAALSVPFIAGVEGYVFESIFHYVKGLPLPNPYSEKRSKLLFDCVDANTQTGWSLKAVQKSPDAETFELVIQRADVIKKKTELGFSSLTLATSPDEIGHAVLRHWNNKIEADMIIQNVTDPRIGILVKSRDHRHYAFLEQTLHRYSADELTWRWTDETKTGLQARNKTNSTVALRWYPNQKQLFETFTLSPQCFRFEVEPDDLTPEDFIRAILRS